MCIKIEGNSQTKNQLKCTLYIWLDILRAKITSVDQPMELNIYRQVNSHFFKIFVKMNLFSFKKVISLWNPKDMLYTCMLNHNILKYPTYYYF